MIGQNWMKWTLLEATTKTTGKIVQKLAGVASRTVGHAFFVTLVTGVVHLVAGFCVAKAQKKSIWPETKLVLGCVLFGLTYTIATVLTVVVFLRGGEIGVNTFIVTLSIIPGAVIDHLFFNHKIFGRHWMGIAIFLVAGYAVLGMPSLKNILTLPLWVWLSFGVMLMTALNQVITQAVKDVDPFVKNFWAGATIIVLCAVSILTFETPLIFLGYWSLHKLILISVISGCIVVGTWVFSLLSYKGGASIALKKLVMNSVYLSAAMLLGALFFKEPLTMPKIIGVGLYFVAFSFMDDKTWSFFSSFLREPDKFKIIAEGSK